MPYIGYEFSCSWDKEHALGFMMLKDNVVACKDEFMSEVRLPLENELDGINWIIPSKKETL